MGPTPRRRRQPIRSKIEFAASRAGNAEWMVDGSCPCRRHRGLTKPSSRLECLRCNAAVAGSPCFRFSDRAVAQSRRCAAAAAIAECQSEAAAIRRAEGMSSDPANAGAIAFKRAGDPNVGEFSDAVVLKRFGNVPEDLSEL